MTGMLLAIVVVIGSMSAWGDSTFERELHTWRDAREQALRADNGWLTLAGRFALQPGVNTIGTGRDNDVVFPVELKGTGPERLGVIHVDAATSRVTLQPADGVEFVAGDRSFTGAREFAVDRQDWVGLGRLRFQIIVRDGKFVLRLADNASAVRRDFPGCLWYPADERFRVEATFVPYPEGRTIPVVNVLGQTSEQPCPGFARFRLDGEERTLDAIAEGDGLFFVFRDATAGDTTYPPARFLTIDRRPPDHASFTLDFNRAYNPPCAVSAFTTCPTAPKANVIKVRVEAGEKYRKR